MRSPLVRCSIVLLFIPDTVGSRCCLRYILTLAFLFADCNVFPFDALFLLLVGHFTVSLFVAAISAALLPVVPCRFIGSSLRVSSSRTTFSRCVVTYPSLL